MDLVYFWIDSFRSLKNTGFNLHKDWELNYSQSKNSLTIKPKAESLPDDFFGKNVTNLKVIVGENGSGKTLSLELIYGFLDNYHTQSVVVLGQQKGNNYHLRIYYHRSMRKPKVTHGELFSHIKVDEPKQHGTGTNQILHNMLSDHLRIVYLNYGLNANRFHSLNYCIDLSSREMFDRAQLSPFDSKTSNKIVSNYFIDEAVRISHFLGDRKPHKILGTRITAIGFHFPGTRKSQQGFAERMHKIIHEDEGFAKEFAREHKRQRKKNPALSWVRIKNPFFIKAVIGSQILLYLDLQIPFGRGKTLEEFYNDTKKNLLELTAVSKEYKEFFTYIDGLNTNDLITEIKYDDDLKLFPGYFDSTSFQFLIKMNKASKFFSLYSESIKSAKTKDQYFLGFHYGVSSGEIAFLSYFSRIFDSIEKIKEKSNTVFLIDESELHLHPSWQKKFLSYFLDFVAYYLPKNKIQIVIATHSPFIFSDIPVECGIILHRRKNKYLEQLVTHNTKESLGANIHQLFTDTFLIHDSLMGDFAKKKIVGLITKVNRAKKIDIKKCAELIPEVKLIGERYIRKKIFEVMLKKADNNIRELIQNEIIEKQ